jgi:hypothetical protein
MKKICTLVVAVLFLSIGAFAVPFGEGSVVFVISLPGPGNFRAPLISISAAVRP